MYIYTYTNYVYVYMHIHDMCITYVYIYIFIQLQSGDLHAYYIHIYRHIYIYPHIYVYIHIVHTYIHIYTSCSSTLDQAGSQEWALGPIEQYRGCEARQREEFTRSDKAGAATWGGPRYMCICTHIYIYMHINIYP